MHVYVCALVWRLMFVPFLEENQCPSHGSSYCWSFCSGSKKHAWNQTQNTTLPRIRRCHMQELCHQVRQSGHKPLLCLRVLSFDRLRNNMNLSDITNYGNIWQHSWNATQDSQDNALKWSILPCETVCRRNVQADVQLPPCLDPCFLHRL